MIQQVEILGGHAWFYRDGLAITVPGAATSSRTSKPGAADPLWRDFGIVDLGLSQSIEEKMIRRPAPAIKELEDIIAVSRDLTIKIKKQELSNIDFELMFGSLALPNDPTAGGQFNPLELQAATVKGWLKMEWFGRQSGRAGNNPLCTADLYVSLKFDGDFEPGDEAVEPTLLARVLRSTLNTGSIV